MTEYKIKLTLGIHDGKYKDTYEEYKLVVSKDPKLIAEAYKKSCDLTGYVLHDNDIWDNDDNYIESKNYVLIHDYEIKPEVLEVFKSHGYEGFHMITDNDSYFNLWFWFVGLSLEGIGWGYYRSEPSFTDMNLLMSSDKHNGLDFYTSGEYQ